MICRVMGLRGLLWRLFAVLASLILPVALASAWLSTVVTDSDAYVDTVGPLASDPTVQQAVADAWRALPSAPSRTRPARASTPAAASRSPRR